MNLIKFRALCICGTRLTSAQHLPRLRIWVLGRDRFSEIFVIDPVDLYNIAG
ncbi:hypothetical protein SLEP1_g15131 [Rubroshorea leprosula]|uniref:Uncharacterized protein n=1 Tax=Rubroshorea leprosula TaxID=152421 RepID=A0AAV5ISA7_9ROSI|nr:hypothetical protein SLEP1_g15131 [Rubroshorea leprosula]